MGRRNEDFVGVFTDLVSTVWSHQTVLYLVDLRKSYDSVPREALWTAWGTTCACGHYQIISH